MAGRGWGTASCRTLSQGSGVLIVLLVVAIGLFLLWRAVPALQRDQVNFFTYGGKWVTTNTAAMRFGILNLLQVTALVSVFALVLAMPIALGAALFVTQYAPRRVGGLLAYMVDLLAAVPSIIYGVWGLYVLAPQLRPVATWLNHTLGWCFLFARGNASVAGGGTIFTGGIVLAVMIIPIVTAVHSRSLCANSAGPDRGGAGVGRHPMGSRQDDRAPVRRSGYFSGVMLGLGRALGETVALLVILRGTQTAFGWSLFDGGSTFATQIAGTASEFNDKYKAGAYIAAGLVLFLFTFVVDSVARAAVAGTGARRGAQ